MGPLYLVNIYMLSHFFLFLFFVFRNGYIGSKTRYVFVVAALVVASINAFYSGTLFNPFYYLLCYVSLVMLIVSIDILSKQIFELKTRLVNNFWFWFGSASILYNAFTLMIFALYFFTMRDTPNGKAIGDIQHFANAVYYLLIAFALLKIPVKQLQYPGKLTGLKK